MNENIIKKLNPTETINKALPVITEAFINFYGESERERITNSFKNLLIIGYSQPDEIKKMINKDKNEKINNLIKNFNNNCGFDYIKFEAINVYISYLNGKRDKETKEKVVNFLQGIYPEINITINNIDELINQSRFKEIDFIIPFYNQLRKDFNSYLEEIKPYTEYINKCDKLKFLLEKKYTKKLMSECSYLFSKDEYQKLENELDRGLSIKSNSKIKNYFGSLLGNTALIESFSEDNQELIDNNDWKKQTILMDRVTYFNNLGIDLGNDYETYIKDFRVKELYPSKEMVNKLINIKKEIYTQMINEYYTSLPEYKVNKERIRKSGLLDKDDKYDANSYYNKKTMEAINLKKVGNEYIINPILLFYVGEFGHYLDHHLIHELNHVVELSLKELDGEYYSCICGWEVESGKINGEMKDVVSLEDSTNKGKYELFNEIINELISQEISDILTKEEHFIFNSKSDKVNEGGTFYERMKFLVSDFYEIYKREIIKSRNNGNMDYIFEVVGKNNFEALNELFHIYKDNFIDSVELGFNKEFNEKIRIEKAIKYEELKIRRDKIILKMQEYSNKKVSFKVDKNSR